MIQTIIVFMLYEIIFDKFRRLFKDNRWMFINWRDIWNFILTKLTYLKSTNILIYWNKTKKISLSYKGSEKLYSDMDTQSNLGDINHFLSLSYSNNEN